MLFKKSLLLLALAGSFCIKGQVWADDTTGAPTVVTVGNTNNPYVSYLVIDDTSLGNSAFEYAWHYSSTTEAGTTNPLTGTDLLNAVIAGTTNTQYALSYTTGASGLMTSFSVGSNTSVVIDPLATPVWTYWVNGGSEYAFGDSNNFTFVPTNWVVSPNTSDYRYLTNGSSDGWTLSDYAYPGTNPTLYYTDVNGTSQAVTMGTYSGAAPLSTAAVPEPSSTALLFLGSLGVIGFIRCKSARRA